MNSGTVVFTAVLILEVTLSHQNHDYASGKQAKRAWRKAVKAGKTTGKRCFYLNLINFYVKDIILSDCMGIVFASIEVRFLFLKFE